MEKWARAKVQIISASFYFTWDLSTLIFKLIYIYIYMFLNFLYVVGVQGYVLFQILNIISFTSKYTINYLYRCNIFIYYI